MTYSFGIWLVLFILIIGLMIRSIGRKRRRIDQQMEDVAADALPQIGEIAERAHSARFGRPPTNLPVPPKGRGRQASWYPASKTHKPAA